MDQRNVSEVVDRICDAFETAWKSGQSPDIREWLQDIEECHREHALPELLRVDLAYRLNHGTLGFSLDSYVQSFGIAPDDISLLKGAYSDHHHRSTEVLLRKVETDRREGTTSERPLSTLSSLEDYEILTRLGQGGMGIV